MKDKMRCARCGKTFKPARSSQTLCDQCEKQERAARAAAKATSATPTRPGASASQPVRIVGPAANLLDPTAPSAPTGAPPPDTGLFGAAAIREEQRREQQRREEQRRAEERARDEQRARERAQTLTERRPLHDERQSRPTVAHGPKRGGKPVMQRGERPAPAPRQPKAPRPVVPQFEMTDELRSRIETRYLELAQPIEFDGIRTQIAAEIGVPKSHVKHVVAELRARMQLPSWWELQSYSGAENDLERIRMAYLPHLPVPEVGIHKTLAESLNLDPRAVYQGIRRIRAEMRLPQYNAPEAHGDIPINQRASAAQPGQPAQPEQPPQAIHSGANAASDIPLSASGPAPEQP